LYLKKAGSDDNTPLLQKACLLGSIERLHSTEAMAAMLMFQIKESN
jgi:hypothetical protein